MESAVLQGCMTWREVIGQQTAAAKGRRGSSGAGTLSTSQAVKANANKSTKKSVGAVVERRKGSSIVVGIPAHNIAAGRRSKFVDRVILNPIL